MDQIKENTPTLSLKDKLKVKESELSILYKINQSLASGYIEHLLTLTVNLMHEFLGCSKCSINLLDDKKEKLIVRAAFSHHEEFYLTDPIQVSNSLSGICILERRSLQWLDVTKEEKYAYKELAQRIGLSSMLAIPLIVKNEIIGVMNFYAKEKLVFSEDQIKFLEMISNQIAIALKKQKLSEEVFDSKRQLEERKMVERAKSILMSNKGISENEAYTLMRKTSMSSRKPMIEIAKTILFVENIS